MQTALPEPDGGDVRALLRNIPACRRCRQNHRRCDSSLPSCRNCIKSGHKECVFFDPILGEDVQRRFVSCRASPDATLYSKVATNTRKPSNGPCVSVSRASCGRRGDSSVSSHQHRPLTSDVFTETLLWTALLYFNTIISAIPPTTRGDKLTTCLAGFSVRGL